MKRGRLLNWPSSVVVNAFCDIVHPALGRHRLGWRGLLRRFSERGRGDPPLAFLYPFSRGQCPKGEPQLLKQGRQWRKNLRQHCLFRRPCLRKLSHVLAQRSKPYILPFMLSGTIYFDLVKCQQKEKPNPQLPCFRLLYFFFLSREYFFRGASPSLTGGAVAVVPVVHAMNFK